MYQIIRNLFPPYMAKFARQEAVEIIDTAYRVAQDDILESGTINMWKKQRGIHFGRGLPPSFRELVAKIEKIVQLKCLPGMSGLRIQEIDSNWPRLPWHQDAAGMGLADGQKAAVAWVPLDPIDGTRPTLEISEGEDGPLVGHERDDALFLKADSTYGPTTILIGLNPGDVVLFSPLTLHRTYFAEGMTNPRLSLDLRFFGSSA